MIFKEKNTNKNSWNPQTKQENIPNFITNKVDNFYTERVLKKWHGRNIMKGKLPNNNSILVHDNDYLCLSGNSEIIQSQQKCLTGKGNGQMMSAIFYNGENLQETFEEKMANFLGVEDVLTTQSGWNANVGLIQSIAGPEIPVYIDMCTHMSLWEGAKSAGSKIIPFAHNDIRHLEKKLKRYGPGIIAVDSIYSADGDICPLKDIVEVGEKYGCAFVVDESHSLGTIGTEGKGLVAELGLTNRVHFITSSLSKGFCTRAGIITCSSRIKGYMTYTSLPAIFSSAVNPHDLAGLIKTIDVIRSMSSEREKLAKISNKIRNGLLNLGFDVTASKSHIISLLSGTESTVMLVRDILNSHGVFGSIFMPPATTQKKSLYRLSLNASLNDDDIEKILNACLALKNEVGDLIPDLFLDREKSYSLPKVS